MPLLTTQSAKGYGLSLSSGESSNTGFFTVASTSLTTSTSTVSFTSIPSSYKILQIRVIARTTSTSDNNFTIKFNNSSSDHRRYLIYNVGSSSTDSSYEKTFTSEPSVSAGTVSNDSRAASYFGYWNGSIIDYASTDKVKTLLAQVGRADGTNGLVGQIAIGLSSTSAISQIDFTAPSGQSFKQYSRFSVYGIK